MPRRIIAVACAFALLAAPAVAAENDNTEKPDDRAKTYELLNLFGDVFERIRADYVEKADDEKLVEAAINGMLSSLDPHSSYLNPKHFGEMKVQTQGTFGGLGIEVSMENGLIKVVSPIDDTPAAKAGIEPGDLITQLDGEPVMGMTLPEAVDKMRGDVGTTIKLTIRRGNGEPFDVTLTRAVIKIKSVRSRLEGEVGYVRVSSFSEQTDVGLKEAVEKLKHDANGHLEGLILDLRNNPGGLLSQAVAVSDDFLDKGEIVSTRARNPDDSQRFNAHPGDIAEGLPLVVLINGGSASASEIVAGALQDQGRAIVLGTKSFGKGSVQTIIPLADHGAMRLTTARYYTPSGRSIQAVGIEPDIVVQQARLESVDQPQLRREADLRGALENDRNGDANDSAAPAKTPAEPAADKNDDDEPTSDTSKDYQLVRAIDLVRGLALYHNRIAAGAAHATDSH